MMLANNDNISIRACLLNDNACEIVRKCLRVQVDLSLVAETDLMETVEGVCYQEATRLSDRGFQNTDLDQLLITFGDSLTKVCSA